MAHSLLNRLKSKREPKESGGGKHGRLVKSQSTGRNAAEMVLNMYELLENILSFLPSKHLRKVQCVCQLWNDIILRSTILKSISTQDLNPGARRVNIRLLGGRGVGKRCLAMNWDTNIMSRTHQPYGNTWPARKHLTIDNEAWDVRIEWDSNGALEQFIHLPYQSHAYALIYSVTSRTSFERIRTFFEFVTTLSAGATECAAAKQTSLSSSSPSQANTHFPTPLILSKPIALIANKCDFHSLLHGWDVDREEGLALAKSLGCAFYETSAKSGEGVDEALDAMMCSYKTLTLERLATQREENRAAAVAAANALPSMSLATTTSRRQRSGAMVMSLLRRSYRSKGELATAAA